jgi:sugar O-acyltransferase (sialic acid O-acetyltransferase NeuD family)
MKKIIILGGGGFASEVVETIEFINLKKLRNRYLILGYIFDGGSEFIGEKICDAPILGDFSYLNNLDIKSINFVCAVGTPEIKRKIVKKVKEIGGNFVTIVHPTAYVSPRTKIGEGCIVQGNCILVGHGIKLGDFVSINDSTSIGHFAKIGNYCHINPNVNVSGESILEDDVFVGVKATILKTRICKGAVIGACALITKDVPPDMMAKGIPASYSKKTAKRYK